MPRQQPDATVIIVSYRTPELTQRCLETLFANTDSTRVSLEVIVVDNASGDGSVELVSREFPRVRVIALTKNVGFGAANNRGFEQSGGRYYILLNTDAFVRPGAIEAAIRHMDETPEAGAGGGRLTHEDGSWQPSACAFPSPLNDLLLLSGLSARHPRSRFFTRMNRRWADPGEPVESGWVPGAFMILRPLALREIGGGFDESFFLYYEEVDLCRRLHSAGYSVWYWPDIQVVHLGGESAKKSGDSADLTGAGRQLVAWRYRSAWIYYRKHHGMVAAWLARMIEQLWHSARAFRNRWSSQPARRRKVLESRQVVAVIRESWREVFGKRSAELTA